MWVSSMDPSSVDLNLPPSEYDIIRNPRPTSYQKAIDPKTGNHNESTDCENVTLFQDTSDTPYSFSTSLGPKNENKDAGNSKYSAGQNICDRTCATCIGSFPSKKHLPSTSSEASLLSCASDTSTKSRLLVVFVCIQVSFLIATIAFIIVLFVLLHSVQNELEQEKYDRQQNSNTFCVPCHDLILGPMDEDNEDLKQLTRKNENELEVCCAKGSNQTSVLMNLLFKRREKLQEAQEIIDSEEKCKSNVTHGSNGNIPTGKTSAHLLAGVQSAKGSPPYTVHNWIQTAPTAHSTGVQVKDSRIIVNTSGLYFVYSQIFFSNLYNGQSATNSSQALYHYVYRWNIIYPNSGNELLLKSVRTQCWAENRIYGDYTSYTAGTFKLNTGDELYVQASKVDVMSRDMHASFFGIVKL